MSPKILGLVRGLRAAKYEAIAEVVEVEVERMERERAELVSALENLCDAVIDLGDGGDLNVRRKTNRALDLLIILEDRELGGETACA